MKIAVCTKRVEGMTITVRQKDVGDTTWLFE